MNKIAFTAFILSLSSPSLSLAGEIRMGTGGKTGTYYSMAEDISYYCGEDLGVDRKGAANTLLVEASGGSLDNLEGLKNKRYSVIWTQEDVLMFQALADPKSFNDKRLKIIAGGHLETFHFLYPNGWKPSKGFSFNFFGGDNDDSLNIEDLKNQTIGAWGGSLISLKQLGESEELDLNTVDLSDIKDNPSQIDIPILMVGGSPYQPALEYLEDGWSFLPISNVKGPYYQENSVAFEGKSYETISVQALLVGKSFSKKSRNETMNKLATCISENLIDLADDPDTNANWQMVFELEEEGMQSNWDYFEVVEN